MSTSKGRKKYRIRKGRVAMAAGVLFLIIGLIVFVCIRAGKKHRKLAGHHRMKMLSPLTARDILRSSEPARQL